ncbi:copper chaperone CopZ [Virgibacillus sp. W0181]|uniref:copper chaperone CopZ n=1 Tax=Virgibacillus sp. W0181 TaxID=3391581 RepID=UPI003F457638
MNTTIKVEGMSCGHCVSAVQGALENLKGVASAEVTLSEGKVEVTYDDTEVTTDKMKQEIEDQGYDVVA